MNNAVWIYSAAIHRDDALTHQRLAALPADDRQQAERYRHAGRLHGFVASRRLLRHMLSRHADKNTAPDDWRFSHRDGRLCLDDHGRTGWYLSLSHGADRVACLLAKTPHCGVDIENTQRTPDMAAIARRYFHPDEYQALLDCDDEQRRELFFSLWTRKEACIKAWHRGIAGHLAAIRFEAGQLAPAAWPAELQHLPLQLQQYRGPDWLLSAAVRTPPAAAWVLVEAEADGEAG